MALREERPAEFTDEERWARYFTTTSLIALMVLGGVCLLICRICMRLKVLPLGIAMSIVIMGAGAFVFLIPVPEGDLWHGQGTLIAKVLMPVMIRKKAGRIYVRILPRMGAEDKEKTAEKKIRRNRRQGRRAG